MKKIVFILYCLLSSNSLARNFEFNLEHCAFKESDSKIKVELYFSYPDKILKYQEINKIFIGKMNFNLEVKSNIKTEVLDSWNLIYQIDSLSKLDNSMITGIRSFIVPPGEYEILLTAYDDNDTLSKINRKLKLITPNFKLDKIHLSDIELASYIENSYNQTDEQNKAFQKNGYIVYPNPKNDIFGEDLELKFYYEIYNAKKISFDSLRINYSIFNSIERQIYSLNEIIFPNENVIHKQMKLNVDALSSGVYFLKVKLSHPINSPVDSESVTKKFYVYNNYLPPENYAEFTENESFEKSEFATLSDERTDLEIRMTMKIVDNFEKDQMSMLGTKEAKQKYLFRFWQNRKKQNESFRNEAREKFRENVAFANTYFLGVGKEGWDTDRGALILKFGKPSNRENNMATGEKKAYEEWWYGNLQGGAYFYFVDLVGMGDYTLVHSTLSGYAYNPNWYNELVLGKKISTDKENSNNSLKK